MKTRLSTFLIAVCLVIKLSAAFAVETDGDFISSGELQQIDLFSPEVQAQFDADTLKQAQDLERCSALEACRDKMRIEDVTRTTLRLLLFDLKDKLSLELQSMFNRITLEGDPRRLIYRISSNVASNAAVKPFTEEMPVQRELFPQSLYAPVTSPQAKESPANIWDTTLLEIFSGLFGDFDTLDDLGAVMSHELTHSNLTLLQTLNDSAEVSRLIHLNIKGFSRLAVGHQEEIRADLGAVKRLIHAKLNPWAMYYWLQRHAKTENTFYDGKTNTHTHTITGSDKKSVSSHPITELRMTAVKAYIGHLQSTQDLSGLINKWTPLSPTLKLLKLRALALKFLSPGERVMMGSRAISRGLYQSKKIIKNDVIPVALGITGILASTGGLACLMVLATDQVTAHRAALDLPLAFLMSLPSKEAAAVVLAGAATLILPKSERVKRLTELGSFLRQKAEVLKKGPKAKVDWILMKWDKLFIPSDGWRIEKTSIREGEGEEFNDVRWERRFVLLEQAWMLQELSANITVLSVAPDMPKNKIVIRQLLEAMNPQIAALHPEIKESIRILHQFATGTDISTKFLTIERLAKAWRDRKFKKYSFSPERYILSAIYAYNLADFDPFKDLGLTFDFAAMLPEKGFRLAAAQLLLPHLSVVRGFVFSKDNTVPERGFEFGRVLSYLREYDKTSKIKPLHSITPELSVVAHVTKVKSSTKHDDLKQLLENYLVHYKVVEIKKGKYFVPDWEPIRKRLDSGFDTASSVVDFFRSRVTANNISLNNVRPKLASWLRNRPSLIKNFGDVDAILSTEYFWPNTGETESSEFALDGDFRTFLEARRKFRGQYEKKRTTEFDFWSFDTGSSEKLQRYLIARLHELHIYPTDVEGEAQLWEKLVRRGVTSVTDGMFESLLPRVTKGARLQMEDLALQGAVFEPHLKVSIVRGRIAGWVVYKRLLQVKPGSKRIELLNKFILEVRRLIPERGVEYGTLLEELSVKIESNLEEAELIEAEKEGPQGIHKQDIAIRLISNVLEGALHYSLEQQWELVQFLREEVPVNDRIESYFPTIGPQRVLRLFRQLSVEWKTAILSSFLDSPSGLLPKIDFKKGYAPIMTQQVLKGASPEEKEIATQLLEAFVYSLEAVGNGPFQSGVFAYLLAQGGSGVKAGESLKRILEFFGTTGVKIGQFLVSAEILPVAVTDILRGLQERANVPTRVSILRDIKKIHGGKMPAVRIGKLLGSASLKYATEIYYDRKPEGRRVWKVLREVAIARTPLEFKQLYAMANYLCKKFGPRYGVLRAIVAASEIAIQREKNLQQEADNSEMMDRELYRGKRFGMVRFSVPKERPLFPRLMESEFAPGVSVFSEELSKNSQLAASKAILAIDGRNIRAHGRRIHMDPDRHAGNYRVFEEYEGSALREIVISPIDEGQATIISGDGMGQFEKVFALSQILKITGPTDFAAAELTRIFGLKASMNSQVRASLGKYFPSSSLSEPSAYYSAIAAIFDLKITIPQMYFDLFRGTIQFKPYETLIGEHSVTDDFIGSVKRTAQDYLTKMNLSPIDKARVFRNVMHTEWKDLRAAGVPLRATGRKMMEKAKELANQVDTKCGIFTPQLPQPVIE